MRIDMTNFKMIYRDQVHNCLSMITCCEQCEENKLKVVELEVTFINTENRIEVVRDKASMFQFINK